MLLPRIQLLRTFSFIGLFLAASFLLPLPTHAADSDLFIHVDQTNFKANTDFNVYIRNPQVGVSYELWIDGDVTAQRYNTMKVSDIDSSITPPTSTQKLNSELAGKKKICLNYQNGESLPPHSVIGHPCTLSIPITVKRADNVDGGPGADSARLPQNTAGTIAPTLSPPAPPCLKFGDGKCTEVDTALGKFPTDPLPFISKIFSLILGLAGGIALLLIIQSGYKLMTSQGNPQTIQGARETLTSAIVGLLFIIFSLVILQVIGVDILHIPGFSQGVTTCPGCY